MKVRSIAPSPAVGRSIMRCAADRLTTKALLLPALVAALSPWARAQFPGPATGGPDPVPPHLRKKSTTPPAATTKPAANGTTSAARPSVERIDDDHFRIGTILFNAKTRELRFPASVELTEGLLEFLVVHGDGKIHESLLVADAKPSEIQLALTLLRFRTSPELFPIISEDGLLTGKYPEVPGEQREAARLRIDFEWTHEGRVRRFPASDWVQQSVTKKPMPPDPWIFGGSEMQEGAFAADLNGEIAAIFTSNTAVANFSGKDREDDSVWIPHPQRVPARGTKITVIIAPFLANPQPPAKP